MNTPPVSLPKCRQTLLYNAVLYTGTTEHSVSDQAILLDGNHIQAVGDSASLLSFVSADVPRIDCEGRFLCAGFNDSHMHLIFFGQMLSDARLAEHTESLSDLLSCLDTYIKDHQVPAGKWVFGRGWNQDYFTDVKRMPDRYDLDRVSTEHPIVAVRCCVHCLVVNTKALELLGITADTPVPEGGRIGLTENEAHQLVPDGRFYDGAMSLVYDALPLPTEEELKGYIRAAAAELNRCGITSSQSDDYCAFRQIPPTVVNRLYRELAAEGNLSVRVTEQCNLIDPESLHAFYEEEANAISTSQDQTLENQDFYRIGPLKMLGDGSLGARTAYLSAPYSDDSSTQGLLVRTAEEFDTMIGFAASKGMPAAVHAIGDGCLDLVLDAYDKALQTYPRKDHRNGIVHCQITRPDQLERMMALGLHIYAQSIFLDYDIHMLEDRIGQDRMQSSYHWKTLMQGGLTVSNGSDCPVEYPDVLRGMECAVTRCTVKDNLGPYLPEQAFTVKEAIDSYTLQGAYASFEEEKKGLLAPGYLADFVLLDKDPFAVPADDLHNIHVEQTWLNGVCVYDCKEE